MSYLSSVTIPGGATGIPPGISSISPGSGRYLSSVTLPSNPAQAQQTANLESQAAVAKQNSDYANSFGGLVHNTLSGMLEPVKNYISSSVNQAKQVGSELIKNPIGTLQNAVQTPSKEIATGLQQGWNQATGATTNMIEDYQHGTGSTAGDIANLANLTSGVAKMIFSPVTGVFNSAEKVPGLKQLADVVNIPFSVAGGAGSIATGKVIDVLPISQQSKNILKAPLQELGSLAAQVVIGGKLMEGISKISSKGTEITPEVAKQIVNEVKQPEYQPQVKGGYLETTTKPESKINVPENIPQSRSLPIGTGERVTSRLAQGVEQNAIERKLTTTLGQLPEYQRVSMKEQARFASDLLNKDPQSAYEIAMGRQMPPHHILPQAIFTAVENKAIETGDVNMLRALATESNLSLQATRMGQEIRALGERDSIAPVKIMQDIIKARAAKAGKAIKSGITEIKSEMKKAASTHQDWATFAKSLKCGY